VEAAKTIKAAIKSGKVSKEDGEKRLIEMRKRMFPTRDDKEAKSDHGEETDRSALRRRYVEAAKTIKSGEVSKEDAEKKLIEMRKRMFPTRGDKEAKSVRAGADGIEAKKRRYMAAAEELEAAVEAGKLSKEDAEKKLIEIRNKMFKK